MESWTFLLAHVARGLCQFALEFSPNDRESQNQRKLAIIRPIRPPRFYGKIMLRICEHNGNQIASEFDPKNISLIFIVIILN